MIESDVAIIGGGPGGYVAAIRAAQLGLKVALVEKEALGGTCLNRGCIPTKALIRGVELLDAIRNAEEYGIAVAGVSTDFQKMMARKEAVVKRLVGGLEAVLLSHNIRIVRGVATLVSATEVEVAGEAKENIKARNVILAPGAVSAPIPAPGAQSPDILDSQAALSLGEIPKSLAIIGAGVIGVEFATIFARLGSSVTLLEALPKVLPQEDAEITSILEKSLRKIGIGIHTSAQVTRITDVPAGKSISFTVNGQPKEIQAQRVLAAVGRRPNTEGLGLDRLGIATEKGFIKVNERLETSLPGVYAVGDAVGGLQLAHKAFAEGEIAAENAAGQKTAMDYRVIPRCIYTIPEAAAVGMSEAEAREAGHDVQVGRFPLAGSGKATVLGETRGLVKVVADGDTGEILGVHICGPQATELIHEAVLVMNLEGTVEDLAAAIHAHPTLSEAVREAALDSRGLAIHMPARRRGAN
ncbi:MAG TPA: dihydrolipoyl dehydrogenase [Dehalococcoidia bacterium]|nr:dihydrolipoyl dehydrogenase [Dehalococcoidia bacterium]